MNENTRLPNDCFALPRGITWTPVDKALERLKKGLSTLKQSERVPVSNCLGRIVATSVYAINSNPPFTNSAVDGYGFCGPAKDFCNQLKLLPGVAAAGSPFKGSVSKGSALKVLTGAVLPDGVDTVFLKEDVESEGNNLVSFMFCMVCINCSCRIIKSSNVNISFKTNNSQCSPRNLGCKHCKSRKLSS